MTEFPETPSSRPPETASRETVLNVSEVARLLKVPVSWVYEHSHRHGADQIPCFKIGKYLRFSEQAILKWLENKGF